MTEEEQVADERKEIPTVMPATGVTETLPTEAPTNLLSEIPNNQPKDVESKKTNFKKGDQIQHKLPGSQNWVAATILGKAGKNTGKNKGWYNVHDNSSGKQMSLDLQKVEWKVPEEQDENELVHVTEDTHKAQPLECNSAKHVELQKLLDFCTYDEVEDKGQNAISTRWVITSKDGIVKARLVARGFQEYRFLAKDSPTVGKGTMRTFLTNSSSRRWRVKTTDIKSAFLQGEKLDRDVYIQPPVESNTPKGFIWKLRHGLYGLKDGARQFFLSVRNELLSLGCTQSKLDPAMFMRIENGCLSGIICCHIDDFLHAGNKYFETVINKLHTRFLAGKIEDGDFKYIGFRITQQVDGITLDQTGYISNLDHPQLEPGRASQKLDQLNPKEQTLYQRIVGQLNWTVQGSRPDLAFEMIDMSTKLNQATVGDLMRAIKTIGRLKEIKSTQLYPQLKGKETNDWEVFVFTDAALGNLNDGKGSVGAYLIWLKDRFGNCCPIAWQAKKIRRVVRSTIAAEGLEAAIYYRELITNLLTVEQNCLPITAFVDN